MPENTKETGVKPAGDVTGLNARDNLPEEESARPGKLAEGIKKDRLRDRISNWCIYTVLLSFLPTVVVFIIRLSNNMLIALHLFAPEFFFTCIMLSADTLRIMSYHSLRTSRGSKTLLNGVSLLCIILSAAVYGSIVVGGNVTVNSITISLLLLLCSVFCGLTTQILLKEEV